MDRTMDYFNIGLLEQTKLGHRQQRVSILQTGNTFFFCPKSFFQKVFLQPRSVIVYLFQDDVFKHCMVQMTIPIE